MAAAHYGLASNVLERFRVQVPVLHEAEQPRAYDEPAELSDGFGSIWRDAAGASSGA